MSKRTAQSKFLLQYIVYDGDGQHHPTSEVYQTKELWKIFLRRLFGVISHFNGTLCGPQWGRQWVW